MLDMGLPRRSAAALREVGHDAVHLGERGLSGVADEDVLAFALDEDRVGVTLDADFSALLALSGAPRPSVVHLRIEALGHPKAAQVIASVAAEVADEPSIGCIVSVTPGGLRIRRLPIRMAL
jgi:predicted nuclease of predicted toxin-antitoxin system